MTVADEEGWRWSAATGAGFAVLMLAGLTLPWIPPPGDASIDTIRSFFVDHRGAILAGDCLFGLGAALFLWFLGTLSSYLRAAEGGDDQRLRLASRDGASRWRNPFRVSKGQRERRPLRGDEALRPGVRALVLREQHAGTVK